MSQSLSASDAKRVARNISALIAASILSKGIVFFWQLYMAAWLGPELNGVQTTVFGLYAILNPLASLSMGLIAIREISRHPEKIGQYASAMLFSQTLLSGTAYLLLVLLAHAIGLSEQILVFTAIAGISLIVDSFGNIANDLLIAQEQMLISSVMDIGQILLRVGLSMILLWQGWSLLGIYIVALIVGLARSIILWWIHWRRGLKLQWPVQVQSILWPLLLNAWPLAAAAMLSLGYDHADRILLARFLDEEQSGYFSLAFLIHFGVIELISTTVITAMFPLLSRSHADGNNETFGYLSEALSRFILLAALPISLTLSIFAAEVIGVISTKDYQNSIPILQIYAWYTFLTLLSNIFSKALLIQNRQRYMLMVRGIALLINLGLNLVLLLQYRDPRMAAIASVLAEAVVLLLLLRVFRANGFVWSRALALTGRIFLIGAIAGALMLYLGEIHWLLGFTSGAIVYLLGLRYGRVLSEEDLDLLYRLLAAMPFGAFVQRLWKRDTVINF